MAYRLHAMAIGIKDERTVVMGMVVRPKPGRAIVGSTSGKRRGVKGAYRGSIGRAEAQMCASNWCSHLRLSGDRELDPERPGRRAVIGAAVVTEIDGAHKAERTQRGIIEIPAADDIPYPYRNVV
jgi:hypothetical protein